MPLPVIAVALVAVEITAEDALLVAGGTVLLIGLQSQLNNYLNNNHIKNYRSVSPLEISSRSYKQVFIFPDFGQQLLVFSSQLQIEWVKREYVQWQSQIQSSYCNIQEKIRGFLILMQNKKPISNEEIQIKAYLARYENYKKPDKDDKDEEKKYGEKKDDEHSSIINIKKEIQTGKQMQEGQPSSSTIIDKIKFSTGGNNPINPFN